MQFLEQSNQNIGMISKESSDAEDWSNGWWNSSFAIKELII